MPVVNNLRKFRENMDLKQSDVSTAVMTSPNTISRYEIGRQCPMSNPGLITPPVRTTETVLPV